MVEEFVRDPTVKTLVVYDKGTDKVATSLTLPQGLKKKALFFLKNKEVNDQLKKEDLQTSVICSELSASSLQNLNLLANEVYFPLLSNPANRAGWSGPTSKEVMLRFSGFLSNLTMAVGQSKGRTLLPAPPPEAFDEDNLPEKERVHLLETCVIQWANSIQAVLQTDPEGLMRLTGKHPDPLLECRFWESKAADLHSLHEQLTSDKMTLVLNTLRDMKSPLGTQFEKVIKDVDLAGDEASENTRYLQTLKPYYERLHDVLDFPLLNDMWLPMMHTALLVWQHSTTYNTKPRLTVLVQEVCNAIVEQAAKHVNGATVFRLIEDENTPEAVMLVNEVLGVCDNFQNTFRRYQVKAAKVLPEGAWDVPDEILFARLDQFRERLFDIIEFTKIVMEFSKLDKIFLGGTKGKDLTDDVRLLHTDFTRTVEKFQQIPYDFVDITKEAFDDDFYKFRYSVKQLERRLSAILMVAFDDCATIEARFKLLESFEGLLERPIVKDELDKKHAQLLQSFAEEHHAVQEEFLRYKDNPKIDNNLPPVAGSLSWCRGLQERLLIPMEQLATAPIGTDREEAREIEKVHARIMQQLRDDEANKIERWGSEVDNTSQEKLRLPLLRREKETRRLNVNFDAALVRLLREVKYLLQLGIEVMPAALAIFENAETYRRQIGNLDLIVNMYNEMIETLHPVERPLVEKDIAAIDESIERGITELNWKSPQVVEFIAESMENVRAVYDTVKSMKDNMSAIKKIMNEYAQQPLIERKNKPMSPSDFEEHLRKLWGQRHAIIAKHQETVTRLLFETNQALKVNQGSPIWRAYVEYVQDSVRDGLALTIVNSIKVICEQLDPQNIARNSLPPLLEIKLGLYANDVLFNAEDGSAPAGLDGQAPRKSRRDVWQIVNDWVEAFFDIGNIMTRMDGSHYVGDLKKNEGIVRYISNLKKHLDWNQKECESCRQEYIKFEFLWKTDRNVEFNKFLAAAIAEANREEGDEEKKEDKKPEKEGEEEEQEVHDHEELSGDEILPLNKFEEKILFYKELQVEIAEKATPVEIGWLKVNAQPIKQALTTWVTRWIHTYTSFLYNDVTRKLNQLESMMNDVSAGLQQEVVAGDSDALKKVLGFIHQVRSSEKSVKMMFQPLRDTVSLLKKYGKNLDDYEVKLLSEAPMKWDSTVNLVYKVKEKVNNLQNDEVDKIKEKVEKFEADLVQFRKTFRDEAPFSYDMEPSEAYRLIAHFHEEINDMEVKAAKLTDLEKVFELNVSKHRQIKKNRAENKLLKHCWDMVALVLHQFDDWKKTPWNKIDTDGLVIMCKKMQAQVQQMPADVRNWDVYNGLLNAVKNLLTVLPLVTLLRSPSMEERHWRELKLATGKNFNREVNFCLSSILQLELHNHVGDVEYIVELAGKESKIAVSMERIEMSWKQLELEFGEKKGVGIINPPAEIMQQLEEDMAMLQNMQGQGKYVEHFIEIVTKWQRNLSNAETVLFDWLEVQSKWSSLEAIFLGSKDIRVQLPEDSRRFDEIDAFWKDLMSHAKDTPNVVEACSAPGRSEILETMKIGLEQCEKSLNQYLENKRKSFPRFYFLSNAALLDILANGYNPQLVQKHLGDCFDNVKGLEFMPASEEEGSDGISRVALGMYSKDGDEYVEFCRPFECAGAVENWLNRLVQLMRETLTDIMGKAKFTADHWEIERPRQEWLYDYPAQMALTASQVIWTEEVGSQFDAIADGNEQAMKEYTKTLASRLASLIQLVLGDLSKCDRIKVITLITVDVHNRDVVQSLIDTKITDPGAFAWMSQMRYAWLPDTRDCLVKVADATFNYSYEYVGNTGRLVITPLTDRCYITLTQALRLMMGGAPAGPAGTGKTETTKDLGRAMGLPVYVFNCSEQMNVASMGAIFKGLSQTGAWGCFDEFNRIPIEVLSVVSTQVSSILNALRERREEFDFMGEIVKLVDSVGMFITMNPGYAGRTELPENLKALFRSCAMVVPDIQLICENMLMSEGFLQAHRLSKKFTTLYSLSKELLSAQMHYDWGLRAAKAVLRVAGGLKRAEPQVKEDSILMRALRDFNLPKLVDDDKPIFKQLVNDLFPGLGNNERKVDLKLKDSISRMTVKRGLQAEDMFIMKTVELGELLAIRHSVFIIGHAGTGKSECWKTLVEAWRDMGDETVYEILNPKAVRNNELYGWLAKTDWHDGILSTIMRNMARNNLPYREKQNKWIILDGDIDPCWIESLNTVMDDNKVLTLVSNERIPVTAPMRLIFEIANLDNATPATVSRAGILYINKKDIGSKPFLDSWIESRKDDKEKSSLLALFNKYVTPEYLAEMKSFKKVVDLSEINMVKSMCFLLEGLIDRPNPNGKKKKVLDAAAEKEAFAANFAFAVIWAFGGACLQDKNANMRQEFSEWWRRIHANMKFGAEGTVFDYFPDPESGKIEQWETIVPAYDPPVDAYLVTKVFVPTVDSKRLSFMLDLLVRNQRPALLVGNAGTGKTTIVQHYLKSTDEVLNASVNLNYYTDAKALQAILEDPIDKRSGRTFGPPGTKKLVYFIDDLNMPCVDEYGTQSPLALIRQHMDYGVWFDTTKLEKKEIQDVQYLSAMNPTAGSFTINPRLQAHFATFSCLLPTLANLQTIYGVILAHHLNMFSEACQNLREPIVKATIELHDTVGVKFIPSSVKFHYQFNLRDLSAIFQGICLSTPDVYTPAMFVKLWQHECMRVFNDRLVSEDDAGAFQELLSAKCNQHFKDVQPDKPAEVAEGEEPVDPAQVPLLFTSFCASGSDPIYQPVKSWPSLKEILTTKLMLYNESNAVMDLEFFNMAMEHVCRISRIIENPRGNALLVGVGGSGKRSLARLASSICGYDVFTITVTQSYGMGDLKHDLQDLYRRAGVKGLPVTFLLTDGQVQDDKWLVYINDLLSSGHIPSLFSSDDMDMIFGSLRGEAKQQGIADNKEAMTEFFINNVRTNLHVVLCFSPVGDAFRVRCRKFPGLINCTTIDWFHPWPRDALVSVATRFLSEDELITPETRQQLAEHMAHVHISVNQASKDYLSEERRYNYTTPKSFLELIAYYRDLLAIKRADLGKQTSRLETGITTLQKTQRDVSALKEDLTETLVRVGEKAASATVLIAKAGSERKKVEESQALAAIEAQKAKTVSDVANKISEECRIDLEAALPVLQKAEAAVGCLTKAALTTLKSFKMPPGKAIEVTNACMILRKEKGKLDWVGAQRMMKNVGGFLDELKAFDARTIEESTLDKLRPILAQDFFNEEEMKSSSEAAANLCNWVVNVVAYKDIHKNVAPKMAAQKKATEEYEQAQAKLKSVEEKVAAMERKLKEVTQQLTQATEEKNAVEAEAKDCQDRLVLAKRLVDGLADENTRWGQSIQEFKQREITLVGDVLLAAAFVSYVGAFNQAFRKNLWEGKWIPDLNERKVPITEGVDPLFVLADDSAFAKWKNSGLAADRISLENGAIVTSCSRWPLMIDPQLQGSKWIKQKVKDLKVVQLTQKKWLETITQAVQDGDPVLLESLGEDLEASLDPILSRAFSQKAGAKYVEIGGEEVRYNDNFFLYLQTKLSNPHYKPEVAAQCTLINFIVTESGLEDQLLALVVNKEKPELEERRTALVRAINDYMVSLTDLENELLERLSNAPEDILSDVALIDGLEKTKKASTEISQKVKEAKEQEISINAARNEFRDVAAEGSWLYFLLIQLWVIDHMYQYSLDSFTSFFLKGMSVTPMAETTPERVLLLRETIRSVVFMWVNRGTFEKHKLILLSQLCFKLTLKGALKEKLNLKHFEYLVRAPKAFAEEKPSALDWLPNGCWFSVQALIKQEGFERLASDMIASPNRFKEWYGKARPEATPLPQDWRKLDDNNPFMKLCVVRALRQDRMTTAMNTYVEEALPKGKTFTECDAGKSFLDVLSNSLEDSSPTTPVFFILSQGADPVNSLAVIAKRKGMYDTKFHRVALGEGQDVVAMNRLDIGSREGHWVVLENIHLMPKWTHALEKRLDEIEEEGPHANFRVYLSAEPASYIPIGLLDRSIKLTNEPPQGLKANLKRAFASFEKDEFEFKDPKVKAIMFGLCHFHSILIERIKFGPKGWNCKYPFNTGDLMDSSTVLSNYLENSSDKVPWKDIRYIFGEILYGGHITDDWDRLLCMTYLRFYMKEDLMDETELYPFNENFKDERFRSPPVMPYDQYFEYIDAEMLPESPIAFGMHPNAETSVKTKQGDELFAAIMELQPRGGGAAGVAAGAGSKIEQQITDITERIKAASYNLEEIAQNVVDARGPYQNVFLQECERMNNLTDEMRKSLKELGQGLSGELQMSEKMEELQIQLDLDRVPSKWAGLAYPSLRSLASWLEDLGQRAAQLQAWVEDPLQIPMVTHIAHLFNPQSFLTAIMQKTAQRNKLELDKLTVMTDVTRKTREQVEAGAREGAYVSGLLLEGARWNWNGGLLEECLPREMYFELPVVTCRAILGDKMEKTGVYPCPVYRTSQRGPTFIFTAQLRSKLPPEKWTLAGVALVLETDAE